jgi:predicted transposase YdaD
MLDYWVRLYRVYKLYQQNSDIEQVIIFLRRDTSPKVYEDSFQVGNTIHRYRIIRIWECEAQPLLEILELLPLAVLAKSEQPEILLCQVAERVDKIENKRQKSNIAACVELLAGINYSEELIKMYLHDDILKESVTYQRIINEGFEKGEISLLSRQLKKRFGEISEKLQARIKLLSLEQLESLGESLFDFNSIDDVVNWLNQIKN